MSKNLKLEIKRILPGQPDQVFDAWTNQELLRKWFHSESSWTTPKADLDLKIGGKYHFEMRKETGENYPHFGVYKEIVRPEKLVFTWTSEYCKNETLVTLLFQGVGVDKTELTLTHEFLSSEEQCEGHEWGWNGCLERLKEVLSI